MSSRALAYALSVLLIAGLLVVLPVTPALAAPTLTITPMTWDVIGLDSNRPQTASNPNTYVHRYKVCNTDSSSSAPSAQLVWTWGADNHSGQQKIDFVTGSGQATKTVSLGTIAANSCKIASYVTNVTQAKTSFNQYRQYALAASATGATTVNLATRTLWVEKFVSQNRNAIIGTSWKSLTDGTNPCSSATACSVYEGQRYQITLIGKTSTSYNQIQQFLTLPDNIMTIDSIKTTFAIPANTTVNQEYGDGCGWNGPTTTSSGTCDGDPLPQISGGKAGGNPIKTVYTVTINANASGQAAATIHPMITDNSGSSFHYNTDAATKAITLTPKKAADLSITKTHANSATSSAFLQNTIGTTSSGNRYVITVTNNGPSATTGTITVTDTLPSGLTIPAGTTIGSAGATFTNSTAATNGCPVTSAGASDVTSISCATTTSIASGGTATLTLPIRVPSGQAKGQVSNTATVAISTGATDSVDANSANNSSTDSATVAAPPDSDLILTNTHTGNFTRGGTATWSLSLKNDGPTDVSSPQIVDTLPAGITYTGGTGTNWSCTPSGQVVTCTYSAGLTSGTTATVLQISGTVGSDAADTVTNSATGSSSGTDPNPANNTNITDRAIVGQADVSLAISHTGSLTIPSSNGTLTFAVTNDGPDAASSPSIVFTLPAKLTYSSVSGSGWSCSGNPASPTTSQSQVVTCTRSTSLASGATSNVVVTVAVDSSTTDGSVFSVSGIACSGTVQSANVSGQTVYSCPVLGGSGFATFDPDTTDNAADDAVPAYLPADVSVAITPSSSVTAGNTVTYTITVSNAGPNAATNPFFLLTLPTGFTCNTGTAGACVGTLSAPYTTGGTPTLSSTNFDNSCSSSVQEVICPPSGTTTLASGQSYQATVVAGTSATTTPNGANTIPVIAAADQGDSSQTNNSASVTTTISSGNSAPAVTVTFGGSSTTAVNESSTATYTYDWTASDSGGDTISSFVAACGDAGTKVGGDTITSGGTGTASIAGTFVCKFDDGPLTSLVTVTATDNRGLIGTGTNTVTISNVAPTATLSAPASVSASNNFTVSLNSGDDVSNADKTSTSSPLTYAFDCGSGYGDFGTATSTTCTAASTVGSVTVKGQIKDKDGGVSEYTQAVTITAAPIADAVSVSLSHTSSAGVDVTLSAQDTGGSTLTFSIVSGPAIGTVGSITGTSCTGTTTKTCTATVHYSNPAGDTSGNTSFTYKATNASSVNSNTATVTVTRTNAAPVATVALSPASPTTNSTLTATATKSDADADTTTLTYAWKVTRAGNTCTVKTTSGTASLTDTLDLGATHSTTSCTGSDPGTFNPSKDDSVAVFVTPNDGHTSGTEVTASKTVGNTAPTATDQINADKASVNEDTNRTITLAGTDADSDTLTFKITSLPSNGVFYDGPDATGHLITSAEATSGYTVTDASKRVTFVPTANYNNGSSAFGPSFTFTATDGTATSPAATVQIDVDPVNDQPTWNATVSMGEAASLNLRSVSADIETADANLTYAIVTNGSKGTATLTGATLTYAKTGGETGTDSIIVRVTDRGDPDNCGAVVAGACTAAKTTDKSVSVSLDPAPVNNPPTASVTLHTLPNTGGAAVLTSTQAPKTNDKVRATATCGDADGDAVTLTFVWKVTRLDSTVATLQTTTVSAGSCSGSFTDTLDLSKAGFGDKGETVKVEVTPNDGTVDGTVASGSTTVVVSDTPPTATDRIVRTGVDQVKTIVLEGSDIDGEAVTFSITQQPASGSLVVAADSTKSCFTANGTAGTRGSYTSPGTETCHLNATYTPASGVTGAVTFKYKVSNSDAASRIATVTVEIQANPETGTGQIDDAEQETVQGALVSTGSQPSTDDPVETQIVAVRNGRIIITEEPIDQSPPSGFSFFAQQIDIQVLDANNQPVTTTADEPQRFSFLLDPSMLPAGKTVADIKIYRNGTQLSACTGGSDLVQPLPACVLSRTLASGMIQIEVLTTAASTWHFAFPVAAAGGGGGGAPIADDLVATGGTDLPVISPNGDGEFEIVTFNGTVNRTVTWVLDFLRSPGGGRALASASDTSRTARAPWDGTSEGEVLPDGIYYWRLTGSDAAGRSFAPVVGEVEIDTTPPPVTGISFKGRAGPGARIGFEMGEAGTVAMSVVCGDETIKTFATRAIATPKRVEYNWYTATLAQMRAVRRGDCGVVITTEDDVANDATYRPMLQQRLPGPLIRLFASNEQPVMGQKVKLRTRLARCRGQENDRVELWRRLPGEDHFTRVKGKRFSGDCKAMFVITMRWDRVEFRTIWPKQNANYRRGRAEPVLLVARSSPST